MEEVLPVTAWLLRSQAKLCPGPCWRFAVVGPSLHKKKNIVFYDYFDMKRDTMQAELYLFS